MGNSDNTHAGRATQKPPAPLMTNETAPFLSDALHPLAYISQ